MASDGMIRIQSSMTIGSDFQTAVMLLEQQSERLKYFCLAEFMKYASSDVKIDPGVPKLLEGYTHRQQGDVISQLLFFQNTENRIKENLDILTLVSFHIVGNSSFGVRPQKSSVYCSFCVPLPLVSFKLCRIFFSLLARQCSSSPVDPIT
jgi:hypothetical protein